MSSVRFLRVLMCYPSQIRLNGADRPLLERAHPLESHTLLCNADSSGLGTAPFYSKRVSIPFIYSNNV